MKKYDYDLPLLFFYRTWINPGDEVIRTWSTHKKSIESLNLLHPIIQPNTKHFSSDCLSLSVRFLCWLSICHLPNIVSAQNTDS